MKNKKGLMFKTITKYVMRYCAPSDLAYWLSEKMDKANADDATFRCIKNNGDVIVINAERE